MADSSLKPLAPELPNKPEFVDNREVKLVQALCAHLDWLEKTYAQPTELCVATGNFNPEGWPLPADRPDPLNNGRLLGGAEPGPPPVKPIRIPGGPFGPRFEEKL